MTVTGGNVGHLVRDAAVLAGFAAAALLATTFVMRRRREWTIRDLKPELSVQPDRARAMMTSWR